MTTKIDTIVLDPSAALSAPDVSRLTTQSPEGTGVFDVLMKATKLHLQQEYDADRITGQEYATVYLGALQAVMAQSVQFLLNTQQEEKIQAEIALVRQKTVTELAQTDDDIPLGLGFNGGQLVEGLVKSKKDIDALQANLVASQVKQSDAEVDLLGQKIVSELARTCDDMTQASVAGYGFNDNASVEGLVRAELDKAHKERDLIEQKVVTEVSQTSDAKPADLGKIATTAIDGLVKSQKDKAAAETTLLWQKSVTELAQTSESVPLSTPALNESVAVTGVVDKQKQLFAAQTDGFARDAEQKLTKMLLDTWAVSATQGEATANNTNGLDDLSVGAVVTKAKAGIGV